MTAARRLARTLGRALRAAADAYADTAWVYRYGPGFAPTAPVRFAGDPRPAAEPAPRVRPLGDRPPGGRPLGAPAHAPASRSPAHASAAA